MRYVLTILAIAVLVIGGLLAYTALTRESEKNTSNLTTSGSETDGESASFLDPAAVIELTDDGFDPSKVDIIVGDTVQFVNVGSDGMWVASDNHPAHDLLPEFDQGGTGQSYSFTFTKIGSWGFHNHLNASETGVIEVSKVEN